MYQPNISKSPLLSTGIIERDYASGLPEAQAPETIAPNEVVSEPKPQKPKKTFVANAKPVDVNSQTNSNDDVSSGEQKIETDPVDTFAFEDAQSHLDEDIIDSENVEVEIPDDVAKETAKQFTMLLDMGVAMFCEKKMVIDMNSIRTSVLKGEMHPIYEQTFEKVNQANREAAHLTKENQKVVQASFTAIIKDQKIQALNPTNAALANLGMVAISQYASVKTTIASNENMIATALEKTREVSDMTPVPEPKVNSTNDKTKKF